jgi:N-acetyl-gamma-glutamylphosphate reductase
MIEIRNKLKSPVQVIVRSCEEVPGSGTRAFTTLNIPGVGAGNNVYALADERHIPEYTERLARLEMISVRYVPNKIRKED